jgi:CRP-like cAMP-binding protein
MRLAFALPQMLRNDILAQLSVEIFSDLRPFLTRVRLVRGQVLIEPGHDVEHIFFIEDGMVSLVAEPTANRASMQVAMIGREGIVGGMALLAPTASSSITAISQIPGPAVRINADALRSAVERSPALRDLCLLFIHSLLVQTMETAASNAQNTLAERCVRWLLMAHERIESDELMITHEALATILGVRRSGVTVVVAALQEAGLIRANRGRITIADRLGLERAGGRSSQAVDAGLKAQRVGSSYLGSLQAVGTHAPANHAGT